MQNATDALSIMNIETHAHFDEGKQRCEELIKSAETLMRTKGAVLDAKWAESVIFAKKSLVTIESQRAALLAHNIKEYDARCEIARVMQDDEGDYISEAYQLKCTKMMAEWSGRNGGRKPRKQTRLQREGNPMESLEHVYAVWLDTLTSIKNRQIRESKQRVLKKKETTRVRPPRGAKKL